MFKRMLITAVVIGFCFTTSLKAQAQNYQPPNLQKNPSGGLLPVLSPDEYRKAVGAASQQNKSAINNQVNQVLSRVPKVAPPPPTSISTVSTPTSTSVTSTPVSKPVDAATQQTINSEVQTGSTVQPDSSVQTVSPIQSAPSSSNQTAPTFPTTSPTTAPTFPNQHQPQVYTGFQAPPQAPGNDFRGQQSKPTGNGFQPQPQKPASGGWNIKY